MKRLSIVTILAAGLLAGTAGSYWVEHRPQPISMPAVAEQSASQQEGRRILYYRNPMGHPDTYFDSSEPHSYRREGRTSSSAIVVIAAKSPVRCWQEADRTTPDSSPFQGTN